MRGRRLTAILAAGLLGIAGCGGGEEIAPEVPGAAADFAVPEATVQASGAGEDAAATDDAATTEEEPAPDGTGTTEEAAPPADTGTTPDTSGGGTVAPEVEADGPTNDTAPPEGSEAEQFEDFCAQNPGAC